MTFARLTRGDAVAMIAALALLIVMSLTWYSTTDADAARQIEELAQPSGGDSPGLQRIREDATFVADRADRNSWEASGTIDRAILVGMLATILLAVTAAWLRAADRRLEPPATPSAAAAVLATVTAVLVAYRMLQEPGQDALATVEPAALIALALLAVIAFACRSAVFEETAGTAWAMAGAGAVVVEGPVERARAAEAVSEPGAVSESEPAFEPEVELEPEPELEAEPEFEAEPEPEPEAEPEARAGTRA